MADVEERERGERLDRWLTRLAPEFSRNHLQSLIERGCVTVDGRPQAKAAHKLRAGQRVEVELQPTEESQAFKAEAIALDMAFEDEHLLVVNKPAGLVVHPAAGNWSGTLMNGLLAHHPGAGALPRAGIVHRLDKDTSGLMVVGKTLAAVTALDACQIAAREVQPASTSRWCMACRPESAFVGRVSSHRAATPSPAIKMAVAPAGLGKPARTDVQRLLVGEWAPASPAGKGRARGCRAASAGCCAPCTPGRTHQIRVHLTQLGVTRWWPMRSMAARRHWA